MNFLESRLYRVMEGIGDFFLLNLLWLLVCLPVVTIFPATAALFGVVRTWVRGEERSVLAPFLRCFRENLAKSLWVGLAWLLAGALLLFDFAVIQRLPSYTRLPLFIGLLLLAVVYALASVFLFPVLVHYDVSWKNVIRNSCLLAVARPGTSLRCLLLLAFSALVLWILPVTMLVAGSVVAYLWYRLCQRAFDQVEARP